ncbi:uncharacterized protein [Epargyreus clarus]|uniref:uncharacterized protein n=1 Tax=Epargyreus clarus TaxID=520877 RepID=UPI003C2E8EBD
MIVRVVFIFAVLIVVADIEAFVRRDVTPTPPSLPFLDSIQDNVDQFRQCIDQSFAKTVGEVNEKQLQPLFLAISDHLSRISKAVHAFVKRDAETKPDETFDGVKKKVEEAFTNLSEGLKGLLDPEEIKKNFNNVVDGVNKAINQGAKS